MCNGILFDYYNFQKRESDDSESSSDEDKKSKKKTGPGVTSEQKKALLLQRDNYTEKYMLLEKNITRLMDKEYELRQTGADPSLTDENIKLQVRS